MSSSSISVTAIIVDNSGQSPPLDYREYDIAVDGDYLIQLYTPDDDGPYYTALGGQVIYGTVIAAYKVSKNLMILSSVALQRLIAVGVRENSFVIDVPVGTVKSLELCLRLVHSAHVGNGTYNLPIKEVWEALKICDEWNFVNIKHRMEVWFDAWLRRRNLSTLLLDETRQLVYPTYRFNDALNFGLLTKELAYESPKAITELNPTKHGELGLETKILGKFIFLNMRDSKTDRNKQVALNEARDSLKSKLMHAFFHPIDEALNINRDCACKSGCVTRWYNALSKTGIWPLVDYDLKSVKDILQDPGTLNFACTLPDNACDDCKATFDHSKVREMGLTANYSFDGLCMDCMVRSGSQSREVKEIYWVADRSRKWSENCRLPHGRPTWFFSYLGDKNEMTIHQFLMNNTPLGELYEDVQ